ncbi:copper chaperone CopZ [Pseudalkalibacillus sp. A8]|uniref:copper chaperone CopZ n=1 Tax=Pseudalkalibacillus sp. A8 TaxID=3382641 RepID=UPI0038B669A8
MEHKTLKVSGMSCGHCVKTIEGNIGKLNGVTSVKVNLNEGTVDLSFDSQTIPLNEIMTEIEESGYEVETTSCH